MVGFSFTCILVFFFCSAPKGGDLVINFCFKLDPICELHLEYYVCICWMGMFRRSVCT
jgi:hypothetical protein